jgi:hypothetical protein
MKCNNCENDAQYTNADPGANPTNYCSTCLPHWLLARATAGHFPLMSPIVDEEEKPTKKKTSAAKKADADENN